MNGRFQLQWPRENLSLEIFAHEIFNYRYHWHEKDYELNVLLEGQQEFCRGTENLTLRENDVLLVDPGVGHASFAPEPNTRALVLHFSAAALRPYVRRGCTLAFPSCCSAAANRDAPVFQRLRYCAALIYSAASGGDPYAALHGRAGLSMLLSTLCANFDPQCISSAGEEDQVELLRKLIAYLEAHYTERLSLEDLASYAQYNRTYVSTLFKNVVGINFYEYLTRLRLQHALLDLVGSGKTLTEVALDNGFADLKSFNKRFRETFSQSPAEYRGRLLPGRIISTMETRQFIPPEDETVQRKLAEYRAGF